MDTQKTIIRVEKNKKNPYVMIDKRFFEDERLSWKAKGLLGYLLSRPDNWKVKIYDLINRSTDGRDSVYSGLKELEKFGYLENSPIRDEKGKIVYWEKIVHEYPHPENPDLDNPLPGFPDLAEPDLAEPDLGNPPLIINDLTNKRDELINNIIINTEQSAIINGQGLTKADDDDDDLGLGKFLEEMKMEVPRKVIEKWKMMADVQTIKQAILAARERPEVKNVVGYATRIIENGGINPIPAPKKEAPKEVTASGAFRNPNPKYAEFYRLMEQSQRRGGIFEIPAGEMEK